MQLIPFLLSLIMLPNPGNEKDKIYSNEEITCSVIYSTTRQWTLQLKELGTFHLRYSNERSGYGEKKNYDVIGTWVNRNDTIILIASPTRMNNCYFISAKFVSTEEGLKPVDGINECLPSVFKPGIRFREWDGHIF